MENNIIGFGANCGVEAQVDATFTALRITDMPQEYNVNNILGGHYSLSIETVRGIQHLARVRQRGRCGQAAHRIPKVSGMSLATCGQHKAAVGTERYFLDTARMLQRRA